jgi:hypothetical protein
LHATNKSGQTSEEIVIAAVKANCNLGGGTALPVLFKTIASQNG